MTKIQKLKIGLALQAIALLVDSTSYEKIKDKISEIEEIILNVPDIDEVC